MHTKPETPNLPGKQLHVFQTGRSRFDVRLEKMPEAIQITMSLTGPPLKKKRHRKAFAEWFAPIVKPLDSDPRPTIIRNGQTGQEAILI